MNFDMKSDDSGFAGFPGVKYENYASQMGLNHAVPPVAPCSETNASLSSAFKRDKQTRGITSTSAIKSEVNACFEDSQLPMVPGQFQENMGMHSHQVMPQGDRTQTNNHNVTGMTSNNGQSNDHVEIYRDLILRHLIQDISTTCTKLYLPMNPLAWNVDHANRWIGEMCQQFQLTHPVCALNLSGRELSEMSQEQMTQRMPEGGETIYAQLHVWRTAFESYQNSGSLVENDTASYMQSHPRSSDSVSSGWNTNPHTPNKVNNMDGSDYGSLPDYNSDFDPRSVQTNTANVNGYYGMQQSQNMGYSQTMQQMPAGNVQQSMPGNMMNNSSSARNYFMCNQQVLPSPSDSDISSNASTCLQDGGDDECTDMHYMAPNYGPSQLPLSHMCAPEAGYGMPMHLGPMGMPHPSNVPPNMAVGYNRNSGTVHLWHFIRELLDQPKQYSSCVRWVDREEGTFKIESSHHLARFWGQRKNRSQMNYDKLSRSLRQYYKKGIIQKPEKKQRLVYKFLPPYNL
uniref:DNA-binding protein D-ETS-4 n=1 Tax=Panagrellus redivivus TaxID=6233 RepID=A0A7E4UZW5_PANRE